MRIHILFYLILSHFFNYAIAQTYTGKVIAITDGDTFKMLINDSTQVRVRVANIDCPEKKQPFSTKAKQFTSDAIFGKEVRLNVLKTDRYGRLVALVFYNNNLNLSEELVTYGMAWHFVRYSKDQTLKELEEKARLNSIGLWSSPNPIPPWEWRKGLRN